MIRSVASFTLAIGICALAHGQKSFVQPQLWKDSSGITQAIAWNVSGGQLEIGPSGQLGRSPVDALFSLYGNDALYKWLTSWINGAPADMTLDAYSLQQGDNLIWTLSDMVPDLVILPRCDVNSAETSGLRAVGRITFKAKEGASLARVDEARRQKKWLCSNFRLRLGDLPCSRTVEVDSISMKRTSGDLDGDGEPDIYYTTDQVSFEVPMADAPAFIKAFEGSASGTPTTYRFQLDFLDADGNTLMTFGMDGVLSSVGPTDLWLDPTSTSATLTVTLRGIKDGKKSVLNVIR